MNDKAPFSVRAAVPQLQFPQTQFATLAQLQGPIARFWGQRLRLATRYSDRKAWEFIWLMQALAVRGLLAPGRSALGFAVGQEPIAAALAAQGVRVLATDAPPGVGDAHWLQTDQYAQSRADLNGAGLCPAADFDERVQFQFLDMNALPRLGQQFDFCWSLCAIEHLGDFDHLQRFVLGCMDYVLPGGYSLHTGELFVGPPDQVRPAAGSTIFPSLDEYRALFAQLQARGHRVAPLDLPPQTELADSIVDYPPYSDHHLRLNFDGVNTTSFGFVVQKSNEALA